MRGDGEKTAQLVRVGEVVMIREVVGVDSGVVTVVSLIIQLAARCVLPEAKSAGPLVRLITSRSVAGPNGAMWLTVLTVMRELFKSCVSVVGVGIRFVIDVRAKVSLINRNTFKSSYKDIPINPTTIKLTAYGSRYFGSGTGIIVC